ncbi:ABC transporter permease [Thermoplasmatales archaeon AK]|nr:ABC transporter permease [Thermoplasmatales archaeon AK]
MNVDILRSARSRRASRHFETLRFFFRSSTGSVSFVILMVYVFLAIEGPRLAPYNPLAIDLTQRLLPPSYAHIMGTDDFGRDIFSRILYAIRLDMAIAFLSVSVSYAVGVVVGVVSGYVGRITDNVTMRVMDILFAFPSILFAIAIAVAIGEGFWAVVIAIIVVSIPGFARVARSTVLSAKNDLYVLAAVSQGSSRIHIMFRHVLPQAFTPTVVLYALNLGNAIIVAAALSFLGVGIPPPTPELGAMITEGLQFVISGQWWVSIFPGLFILFIVIGFNMMGDAAREAADVTLRR